MCPEATRVTVTVVDDGKPARKKSPQRAADERLLKAARNGDLEGTKAALAEGANLEATDAKNQWTSLFWSTTGATEGHAAVALHLIAVGANVNAKCSSSTPLMSAVRQVVLGYKSTLEVVQALLAAGADPNRTYTRDRVLTLAKEHPDLRSLLLAAGALESEWVLREQGRAGG